MWERICALIKNILRTLETEHVSNAGDFRENRSKIIFIPNIWKGLLKFPAHNNQKILLGKTDTDSTARKTPHKLPK